MWEGNGVHDYQARFRSNSLIASYNELAAHFRRVAREEQDSSILMEHSEVSTAACRGRDRPSRVARVGDGSCGRAGPGRFPVGSGPADRAAWRTSPRTWGPKV